MYYRITTYLVLLFAFTPAWAFSGELAEADSLYNRYYYRDALEIYRELLKSDTTDAELYLKAGKCLTDIGELEPRGEQLEIYEEAYQLLKRSSELYPDNAEVHFQLARVVGRIALFKGIFSSIGLAKEVKRETDAALEINPAHDGALHILGRWHREVAGKPKLIRGPLGLGEADREESVKYFKKALEINPQLINHHLEIGKTYMALKKYPEARHHFYYVLNLDPFRPIDEKYIEEAKMLLKEIEGKT